MTGCSSLIVTAFRLPFVAGGGGGTGEEGGAGRVESRDEWARSLGRTVSQAPSLYCC